MNIINQIVDRQSVLISDQEICRAVIQCFREGIATYLSFCRKDRINLLKTVIARAKYNRGIYGYVVLANDIRKESI